MCATFLGSLTRSVKAQNVESKENFDDHFQIICCKLKELDDIRKLGAPITIIIYAVQPRKCNDSQV